MFHLSYTLFVKLKQFYCFTIMQLGTVRLLNNTIGSENPSFKAASLHLKKVEGKVDRKNFKFVVVYWPQ